MKIKFNSGDGLLLDKTIEIVTMALVVRAVSYEKTKIIDKFFGRM